MRVWAGMCWSGIRLGAAAGDSEGADFVNGAIVVLMVVAVFLCVVLGDAE